MRSMEANGTPTRQTARRPTSHKWAIFVLLMFVAVNVMLALQGAFDVFTGIIILLCLAALTGFFAFTRARRTYLIVALTLTLIAVRGAFYGVIQPAHQLLTNDPSVREDWLAGSASKPSA